MEITKIYLNKNKKEGNPMFYADVEIDSGMVIKGFRVLQNNTDGGLFVGMPSQKDPKGKTDSNGKLIYYPTLRFNRDKEGNYIGNGEEYENMFKDKLIEAAHGYSEPNQPKKDPPF